MNLGDYFSPADVAAMDQDGMRAMDFLDRLIEARERICYISGFEVPISALAGSMQLQYYGKIDFTAPEFSILMALAAAVERIAKMEKSDG